jgi:hypothetical protein
MGVVEITQQQFGALNLYDHCRSLWPQERERGWFLDTSEKVVGVLLEDAETNTWGYSICRYRDDGEFHRIAVAADIRSADLARLHLVAAMRRELAA